MTKENINTLVARIESDNKGEFLDVLRQLIENDVASRSATSCLTVVTTSSTVQTRNWDFSGGAPYFERLWAFLWTKPFMEYGRSYALDSALSAPVLEIVSVGMTELISSYESEIANIVVTEALVNERIRDAMLDVILQDGLTLVAASRIKSALAAHLLASVHDKLHDLGVHALSGAGALIAKIAASSVGPIILQKLSYVIAHDLAPIIAKLLAKPAVAAMMKKFIGAAILSSMLKFVTAKAGGAALTTAIFPVIVGWLVMDYAAFPRKLGKSVADALCANLQSSFRSTITDIISKITAEFSESGEMGEFAAKIAKDPDVRRAVQAAARAG